MADGIIVDGKVFPVLHPVTGHPIPVFAWCDTHGPDVPEFKPGDGYNRHRTEKIDLSIWHWTGGENEPERMAKVLIRRKLGIEFAISRLGNIYQFCDPAHVNTADAGRFNSRSVGTEIVCYGFRSWRAIQRGTVPKAGKDRATYMADTHGREVRTAKFYPVQVCSALGLADAQSEALGIPRQVPPTLGAGLYDEIDSFAGHAGHCEISGGKRDPGPWFMQELHDHFTGEVVPESIV